MVGGIRKAYYKKKNAGQGSGASRRYFAAGAAARALTVSNMRNRIPMQLAPAKAARVLGNMQGTVRSGEKKTVDFTVANQTFSTTLAIALLNGVQQGTGRQNRIGTCVKWDKLHLTGQVISQTGAVVQAIDYGRLMIVYDRQPTGTLPVVADLLADVDQAGTVTNNATCGINLNNRKRFSILFSRRFTLPPVASGGAVTLGYTVNPMSEPSDTQIEKYINLSGLVTEYKSNSNPSTIADIATGAIYILTLSETVAAANAQWIASNKARLTFYDEN